MKQKITPTPDVDVSEGDVNVTPRRAEFQSKHVTDSATRALLEEDAKYFLHQTLSTPCLNVLTESEGIYLTDSAGRKIMDFHGNSVHQVGFGNPYVVKAITEQMKSLPFSPRRYTNSAAVQLAKTLCETSTIPRRVLFTPSGTAAIGVALKLARLVTGRYKTVSMWESFHGASLDAISVGGESVFRSGIGPLLPGTEHAPPCDECHCVFKCRKRDPVKGCDMSCAEYVEYILDREKDVACVIAEPIRWTPYIPKKEYWQRIRRACDKHGTLLVFDEIPLSLGRTGRGMFTYQMFDVEPDIFVLGKGLGGGIFPLAACIAREEYNSYAAKCALGHYTHEKSSVGCAAALATLQYIKDNKLIENAKEVGEFALEQLRLLQKKRPLIGDVRGVGLLIGIELLRPDGSRAIDEAERIMYKCMEKGLSYKVTMGNVLTLCPPLIISKSQMQEAIDIIDQSILETQK